MKSLKVKSESGSYEVLAETGAVLRLPELLEEAKIPHPVSMVTNTTVGPLWGGTAAESLGIEMLELPDGEVHKRWPTIESLLLKWLDGGLNRADSVLAIGGGVLTDTAGFAAAVFMRGISWIAVPTTLLAMVDASVGGKTGVNLEQGKNLVGVFWPPRLVVIDVATLTTLPVRELRAGMAEVIKTAWIGDRELLDLFLGRNLDDHASFSSDEWEEIVLRSLAVKARVVSEDEREGGARKALNLGHTLGHALEAATSYEYFLHGEAVAWGLRAAARLGRNRGVLSADGEKTLRTAIDFLGPLPTIAGIDPEDLHDHLGRDKKRDATGVGWVLPTDEGVVLDQYITAGEALAVFMRLQESEGSS